MDWRDQGIVLSAKPHGETSVILDALTASHGRHSGIVRGGRSKRNAATLQPGTLVDLTWRARLESHLGSFSVEPLRARSALMTDRLSLEGLNAVTALLSFSLAERETHPKVFKLTDAMLDQMQSGPDWALDYLHWELFLLEDLGFGLQLDRCAVTGMSDDLAFISPRTGRAVSRSAAGEWAARLLPLPSSLISDDPAPTDDILTGLSVTGYFLKHMVAGDLGNRTLPDARQRLIDTLSRGAGGGA